MTAVGPDVELRRIRTNAEYAECVRIQMETWGASFTERVPLAILKVSQRIGGVTAGAFDSSGRILGFVFGMTGVEDGRLVHWSDLLAVVPEARNRGLGVRLKEYQRELLLPLGVEMIYWTFDPLVARNAHLNLNRLRASAVEYVVDMYGVDTASDLNRGMGTDRFVIAWRIAGGAAPTAETPAAEGPLLVRDAGDRPELFLHPLDEAPGHARIAIPEDVEALQRTSAALAATWRAATRAAFTECLERGYAVVGFQRRGPEGMPAYLLSRGPP
jgi:chorismate synthase